MSARSPRSGPYKGKRVFDLVLAVPLALPAAVVVFVSAAAVKVSSRGPAFFRQIRTGRDGSSFRVVKLRTMVHRPEGLPPHPPPGSVTPLGGFLRRLGIDELPQLLNVLRGEMSLVGPRPTLPYQTARYGERERRRLCVAPGLTGLAQVRGRNGIGWAERIGHDLEYVDRQSPLLDATILWHSIVVVVRGADVEPDMTIFADDLYDRPD